jgi:hypothetical protein
MDPMWRTHAAFLTEARLYHNVPIVIGCGDVRQLKAMKMELCRRLHGRVVRPAQGDARSLAVARSRTIGLLLY